MGDTDTKQDKINVEEIMTKIRADIKAKKARGELPEDIDERLALRLQQSETPEDIKDQLREMNVRWHISSEHPPTSETPFIGPVVILVKRVIRKLTRWYVGDVARQTSAFNMQAVWAMGQMEDRLTQLEEQVKELQEKLAVAEKDKEA